MMPVTYSSPVENDSFEATFDDIYSELISSDSSQIDYIQAFDELISPKSDPNWANETLTSLSFDLIWEKEQLEKELSNLNREKTNLEKNVSHLAKFKDQTMTVSLEDSCQKSSLLQEISTLRHELERLKTLAAASPTSGNPDRVATADPVKPVKSKRNFLKALSSKSKDCQTKSGAKKSEVKEVAKNLVEPKQKTPPKVSDLRPKTPTKIEEKNPTKHCQEISKTPTKTLDCKKEAPKSNEGVQTRSRVKKSLSPNENDPNTVNTTLSESKADKMANMDSKSNGVEVKRKVSKLTSKRHFTVVEPFSFTIREEKMRQDAIRESKTKVQKNLQDN